ncbi:MAG: aminoacyl-tRNA hydrolase, partial [Oscillospiraceae bacterium]|nr:aminoacyl-tRNA hydrolase [Oscillospiraceae bacterium]
MFGNKNLSFIIIGLGNPGLMYEGTRHNVGFRAIDYIAKRENQKIEMSKFNSFCKKITLNDCNVLLMKPQTFMNLSGEAVFRAVKFYKIPPEQLIVLVDDVNFEIGKIRIRRSGSAGGHNGLKSIIEFLGSDEFTRIKIGVGTKPDYFSDLADWVLSK